MSVIKPEQYKMPAEWEPHSATWLAWPYDADTFPGRVEKVEKAMAKIINSLYKSERVELLVLNEDMKNRAAQRIEREGTDPSEVNFHLTEYADVWLRDYGPTFIKDSSGKVFISKWSFNAWGNKFPELLIDGEIPEKVGKWKNIELAAADLVLEGGAIDVNGEGFCMTTEQCLLNKNRNPGITKIEIEKYLETYIGIKKTVWLHRGIVNDHTDGHVDEVARFVSPRKIVCAYEDNPKDENYEILRENYRLLQNAASTDGKPFDIIELPMPHMYYEDGVKAPVSYTNFYIGNAAVLAPVFNDDNDDKALKILQDCFTDREVIGIDCTDIIYGGGAVHCITQQQPK